MATKKEKQSATNLADVCAANMIDVYKELFKVPEGAVDTFIHLPWLHHMLAKAFLEGFFCGAERGGTCG